MPISGWMGCVAAFVVGSIPWGFLAGRMRGVDLREHGSKNIGATNTLRVLGKGAGTAVFVLDTLKGYAPVAVARGIGLDSAWTVGIGLCAVLGHIYSPFVRFRGGKGVATTLGVLLGLNPTIAGIALAVFLSVFFAAGRRVSVGSLAAAFAQAALFWIFPDQPREFQLFASVVGAFVVVRHRENIRRLLRGEEKALDLR